METSTDESLFAWTKPANGLKCFLIEKSDTKPPPFPPRGESTWGILAPSPDCFEDSGNVVVIKSKIVPRFGGGYRWTQQGVQFRMSPKSGTEATNWFGVQRGNIRLPLNCWEEDTEKAIVLQLARKNNLYTRERVTSLSPTIGAKPSTNNVFGIDQVITRPLTITQETYDHPESKGVSP